MSQPYGPTGPYQQQPQHPTYAQPPQGWSSHGVPHQAPQPGPQFPQPPMPSAAKQPVLAWIALGLAVAGIVIAIYRLAPYDGTKSPAVILGVITLIMSIVGLVQATRQITTKGWVATLALLASIGSIAAGWTATQAMEQTERQKSQILGCATSAQTVEELMACTE